MGFDIDSELHDAETVRESPKGRAAADVGALIPGWNIVSEAGDAELNSLLGMEAMRDGNVGSAVRHEVSAAEHAGMAALNFLTLGEAGPELKMAHHGAQALHVGELLSDASDGIETALTGGHSLGAAAQKGFDYTAINAIPAGGGA